MAKILFLAHRLPYPPNKGDKVRSYHLLRHLVLRHEVHVGTFVDDPDDLQHAGTVRGMCASLHVSRLEPGRSRWRSLGALPFGRPLTLDYYRDRAMRHWVDAVYRSRRPDAVVVFSSAMAQYAWVDPAVPVLADLVDVDSEKWTEYAAKHRWPMSWLYRREGWRLLEFERLVAARAFQSFFVTDNEAALFRQRAPECAGRVSVMGNGVDSEFFFPENGGESPFAVGERPVVFTGAMDYWPNVDAVTWFVQEAMPLLRKTNPGLRFYIVGRAPTGAVSALAGPDVVVTGTVPDVRPYLKHAGLVVAPLRLARGVQNKILEAMAMGTPVVTTSPCAAAVAALPGRDLLVAESGARFATLAMELTADRCRAASIGAAGRELVLTKYSWDAHLSRIDHFIELALAPTSGRSMAAA